MQRLRAWLVQGASFEQLFNNLFLILLLSAITSDIGHVLAEMFFPKGLSSGTVTNVTEVREYFGDMVGIIFGIVVIGPILEEIVYRFIPLGIPVYLIWKVTRDRFAHVDIYVLSIILVIVSVYFGYIHGNWGNVLVQGPMGLVFGLVFLKMSYYGERIFRGLAASTMVHMSINGFALSGMFLREFLQKTPLFS